MNDYPLDVGVFGLYHLGPVIASNLARDGHRVVVSDFVPSTREAAATGQLEIVEPGLDIAFGEQVESGRIVARTPDELASDCAVIWIAVDTPMREDNSVDLTDIDAFVHIIAEVASQPRTVLISSQLPVGTTARYQTILGSNHDVAYLPENLRMGQAMADFAESSYVVVGSKSPNVTETVKRLLPGRRMRIGSPETAELTKHATNVLLAQLITFGNAIGDLARSVGADGYEVEQNLRADTRFGSGLPLRPGARFAGGTLERDIRSLQSVSETHGLDHSWLDALLYQNQDRIKRLVSILDEAAPRPLRRVLLLGWLYKADSTSARDAPGRHWATELERRGIEWQTLDPLLQDETIDKHRIYSGKVSATVAEFDAVIVVRPSVLDRSDFVELMETTESTPVLDCWRWLVETGLSVVEPGRRRP